MHLGSIQRHDVHRGAIGRSVEPQLRDDLPADIAARACDEDPRGYARPSCSRLIASFQVAPAWRGPVLQSLLAEAKQWRAAGAYDREPCRMILC